LHPRDYDNLPEDYNTYTNYTFIANVCFNVMNFISTQVLINSLGLNISKTTSYAFSAGMNFVIKECFGQAGIVIRLILKINLYLGSILFTAKFGNKMEKNIIEWRIGNYMLGNLCVFMELTTVLKPEYFILIASLANTCN